MRILDKDELDEQRKTYMRYVGAINKLAKGVGDGSLKGEEVRDRLLVLQTSFLTFILSELVHMSEMLMVMEDKSEDEIDDTFEYQIEEEASEHNPLLEEPLDSPNEKQDGVDLSEPEDGRGSTDLLGRFQGLGLMPDEEYPDEHTAEEGEGEPIENESDEALGGTAKLLSALAAIESAGTTEEAQKIVDDIHELAEKLEDEEE